MATKEVNPNEELDGKMYFLKMVTDFVRAVTNECGRLLRQKNGFGYVHTVRELHDFNNKFSFYVDTGQSMLGGNTVKVWYHPGSRYEKGLTPVLNVWWPLELEEYKLTKLDLDPQWQQEMRKSIERRRNLSKADKRTENAPPKKKKTKFERELEEQRRARKKEGLYAL